MRREYKILLTGTLLLTFGGNLIGPFYVIFASGIGASIVVIGYAQTLFSVLAGILIILVGKISDRLNKQVIALVGYILSAFGILGYLFITAPWHLFIVEIIFAFSSACLAAPLTSLFAKYIQKKSEGFQWGLENGGALIVVGAAVFIGTFIIKLWGFKVLFLVMLLIHLIAILVQLQVYAMDRKNSMKINTTS